MLLRRGLLACPPAVILPLCGEHRYTMSPSYDVASTGTLCHPPMTWRAPVHISSSHDVASTGTLCHPAMMWRAPVHYVILCNDVASVSTTPRHEAGAHGIDRGAVCGVLVALFKLIGRQIQADGTSGSSGKDVRFKWMGRQVQVGRTSGSSYWDVRFK
jgi:hypothetical protein